MPEALVLGQRVQERAVRLRLPCVVVQLPGAGSGIRACGRGGQIEVREVGVEGRPDHLDADGRESRRRHAPGVERPLLAGALARVRGRNGRELQHGDAEQAGGARRRGGIARLPQLALVVAELVYAARQLHDAEFDVGDLGVVGHGGWGGGVFACHFVGPFFR